MAGVLSVVTESIVELPVLAEIPQRVVTTIHDPLASVHDIVKIIEEDAVLSTKILSLANSAFFATVSEINDLTTACSRLGLRQLANIATTISNVNQYRTPNPELHKLMQKLWQHAVATAHCSEALAMKFKIDTSTAFIAGLLHDIGKVVLVDSITSKYAGNVGRLSNSPDLLSKAIDPFAPIVGLHVIQHWKLSDELTYSTLYSQRPELIPAEASNELAYCVQLASDLAESKGFGISNPDKITLEGHQALQFFDLSQDELNTLSDSFDEMLDSVMQVFGSV